MYILAVVIISIIKFYDLLTLKIVDGFSYYSDRIFIFYNFQVKNGNIAKKVKNLVYYL